MSPFEHYVKAEEFIQKEYELKQRGGEDDEAYYWRCERLLAIAQIHATLATYPAGMRTNFQEGPHG